MKPRNCKAGWAPRAVLISARAGRCSRPFTAARQRMVKEGRAQYADPSSMIRACAMLLRHIGYPQKAQNVEMALEVCGQFEKKMTITGRDTGATGGEYAKYILSWIDNPKLKSRWESEVFNVK